jgi:crotonobetainyl-CoA:carnitine CoA-transferase CaiB-like acyl-CoA transferase
MMDQRRAQGNHSVTGPLNGIRIIDTTAVLMGPYATQTLGDMGADVIKVESPGGDVTRQIGPILHEGLGPVYINANRSKRSIVIDLKSPDGKAALLRLIESADVFTYNMRPHTMAKLGLSYEEVAATNPRIIYCGLFGYSQKGPYGPRPAYDDLIQGASTISSLIARSADGMPRYVPAAIADRVTGLTALNAILAALIHRGNSGKGQKIDVPMFETMTKFFLNDHLGGLSYDPPLDKGGYIRQLSKDRRPYQTRDGYVCALIYNNKHWTNFFRAIGREEVLTADPRFASVTTRTQHINEIYAEIAALFKTRTTAEWTKLLYDADIPVMPMHDLETIFEDPHLVATGFFQAEDHPTEGRLTRMREPTEWSDTQPESTRHAPVLGEHTEEILAEIGYSPAEIAALLADKAVMAAEAPEAASGEV